MHSILRTVLASTAACILSSAAGAQVESKKVLTLDGALKVAHAAAAEAKRLGAGGAIAVVDDGGHMLVVHRLDNTFPAAASVALGKARTAAQFRRETAIFENAITKNGRTSLTAVMEMVPLEGGVPVLVDGQVVGAVGVSGAMSAAQDTEIAKVASVALQSTQAAR
jgi:glc operon protein GlcG